MTGPSPGVSPLHDPPRPAELLRAVADFLERDVVPAVPRGGRIAAAAHALDAAAQALDPTGSATATPAGDLPAGDTAAGGSTAGSVRVLLSEEVLPAAAGSLRYQVRVAIRALEVVERELAESPDVARQYRRALRSLGTEDTAGLAAAIRSGDVDDRYEEVRTMLRSAVMDKLRVANPKYLAEPSAEPFADAARAAPRTEPRAEPPTAVDFGVDGLVVIITGASAGLGAALARGLGLAGARLVLGARRLDRVQEVAASLPDAIAVQCDITRDDDREALVAAALDAFGRLDGLVNNAGVMNPVPAVRETADEVRRVLDTNLVAPFDLSRRAIPAFRAAGGGSIVNITSMTGRVTTAQHSPQASYAASKAGLAHLTRDLAVQWGRYRVRVNSVAPGWFPTAMTAALPEMPDWFADRLVVRRFGRDADLVAAVQYLLSAASAYVTGQELVVDGGRTIT